MTEEKKSTVVGIRNPMLAEQVGKLNECVWALWTCRREITML